MPATSARSASLPAVDLWADAWSLDVPRSHLQNLPPLPSAPRRDPSRPLPSGTPPARRDARPAGPRPGAAPPARTGSRPAGHPANALRTRTPLRRLVAPLLFVGLTLTALLVAPLLLNVASMQVEWRANRMESRQDELAGRRSALRAQVAALSSSQRIQQEADSLGLSPADRVDWVLLPPVSGDAGAVVATESIETSLAVAPSGG
jgi:hypothetical protein